VLMEEGNTKIGKRNVLSGGNSRGGRQNGKDKGRFITSLPAPGSPLRWGKSAFSKKASL